MYRLHHRILLAFGMILLLPVASAAQHIQEVEFSSSDMALDLDEAKSFQKYPTYDQYLQMMQDFAADYPAICRLDTFGTSVDGRLLLALKISDHAALDEAEASFLYTSTMHGDELVGFVLLLRLADALLKGYGNDNEITGLVDQLQIWINPLANPDGSYYFDNNLSLQHSFRHNYNDVDLNRNFPDPGAGDADDVAGREVETRFMMEFLREHRFTLSANIHGGSEVVNYPWDHKPELHADDNWYRFISREYADEAMAVDPNYMFGWPDIGITNGFEWYVAHGTRQDYVNYYLGGREVTLELSMEERLLSAELERHWNLNQRSLINYLSQCTYGIRGTVTDRDSGEPLLARIEVLDHDFDHSQVYSSAEHGDFYRLLKEGTYDLLITANGYFDQTISNVPVLDYQATYLDVEMESWSSDVARNDTPEFRLYPNPSSGMLCIEPVNLPPGELRVSIHSLEGKLLISKVFTWQGEALVMDLGQLENGLYLVQSSMQSHRRVHRLLLIGP